MAMGGDSFVLMGLVQQRFHHPALLGCAGLADLMAALEKEGDDSLGCSATEHNPLM